MIAANPYDPDTDTSSGAAGWIVISSGPADCNVDKEAEEAALELRMHYEWLAYERLLWRLAPQPRPPRPALRMRAPVPHRRLLRPRVAAHRRREGRPYWRRGVA